ncbi:hypothetical protein IWW38_003153 [Coemansia aciculifera]|uniref:Uncharacterized protein n=1 Tax=Coemansia aciculifera TaxID=417176 RepID=A0ACC1M295_9FUNG|nr:hypothetical protein IWW38_003153 [Coemansia aciculifera]
MDRPRREALSEWSCVSCAAQSNCYNDGSGGAVGDTWRSLRPKKRRDFTESQAMGLALVLAEQYVRASQDKEKELEEVEEECDGFSLVGWSHIATPTGSPHLSGGCLETSEQRQAFLSLPMRSTRSRDAKMRLVSSGSTVCEPAAAVDGLGKDRKSHRILSRPTKWIKRFVRALN